MRIIVLIILIDQLFNVLMHSVYVLIQQH